LAQFVKAGSVALMRWFRRRTRARRHGPHTEELTAVFSGIYADETWTDKLPGMPRSGRGSLYDHSLSVAEFIETASDVQTVIDVGCGDLTYMSQIPRVTSGAIRYVGYDIVPALIAEHRRLPWGDFRVGDVTAPGFRADADLVIVKDVLFHLDDAQVADALDNLAASSWRYLLLTSCDNETNVDRIFDRWHYAPINFALPPYEFVPYTSLDRVDGGAFIVLRPEDLTWPK
jgi:hypothetical protein